MSLSCPVRHRVVLKKNIKIDRCLSGPGKVLVKEGTKVTPADLVAKVQVSPKPVIFDLPKLLKVQREKVRGLLVSSIGQKVISGQPIARCQSLFFGRRTLIAPQNGVLAGFDEKTGGLVFQPEGKETEEMPALVWGKVAKEEKNKKVTITTNLYEITGVLGKGNALGNLRVLKASNEVVTHLDVEGKFKGEILVVGPILTKDTLKKARVLGIAGLVTGGIHFRDFDQQNDNQMPVLVTEGWGKLAIGDDIWRVLKRFERRTIFLKGEEKLLKIPLKEEEAAEDKPKEEEEKEGKVAIGHLVRLVGDPGPIGAVGEVLEIGEKRIKLESGLKAILVKVKIEEGRVEVPVNNLEIINKPITNDK